MSEPPVAVTMRSPRHDGTGRYQFVLHRGIRSVTVDMPGIPMNEVRCAVEHETTGDCHATFGPRLYVDGNSWWWCYARDIARGELADHDGSAARRSAASEQAARDDLDRHPRCPVCGSVRCLVEESDVYRARCYVCDPDVTTHREAMNGAVYLDEGWRHATHYLVTLQRVPPEVPGHENPMHPDALCGATAFPLGNPRRTSPCRRRSRHEGRCEPYWNEERTLVRPELPGQPVS